MRASVVIPVYASTEENLRQLGRCLAAVEPVVRMGIEVLAVDDGSPKLGNRVAEMVAGVGGTYVRMSAQSGPAMARNEAARQAQGDVLIFFDADTVAHADTVEKLLGRLGAEPELAAVMGSYDESPEARGLVSEFRNLLHCFVHHESVGPAQTFWTGCGAVRRDWFERVGGFSQRYREPSIEDVEFGYRVTAAGGKIWLDPTAQVQHMKRWTLVSMVMTDLWKRAVPWTRLMQEHPLPEGLNFSLRERLAAMSVAGLVAGVFVGLVGGGLWWLPAGFSLAALVGLKWKFLAFLNARRGLLFAMAGLGLLALHLLTAILGFVIGRVQKG
jgi:cellulose synthase/poly-beta-1,6-N-acetylglucosamine synthase-like glycosyltransferase